MTKAKLPKAEREIRTNDHELKAIHSIQKALGSLDAQAAGRVLTFCIDRARQDFERGLKTQVGQAANRVSEPDQYTRPLDAPPAMAEEPAVLGAGVGV